MRKEFRLPPAFVYEVSTLPSHAPVRIEVEGNPDVVTFIGPLQLPLPTNGQLVDPEGPRVLPREGPPRPRLPTPEPPVLVAALRAEGSDAARREVGDFDRVLREFNDLVKRKGASAIFVSGS